MSTSHNKVVFLDRDGVINHDSPDYIKTWDEFRFIDGSLAAIRRLTANQFSAIIITNQSAIHRKLTSLKALENIHIRLKAAAESHGGHIENIFFCPHTPQEGCSCRKPKPGLIFKARKAYGIDLSCAYMVGDSAKDIECARNAACGHAVLVQTGNGIGAVKVLARQNIRPDHVAPNLFKAVDWIIAHDRKQLRTLTTLEGRLERITYFNEETLYIVARLKPLKIANTVTIVGHMAAVQVGETLQVRGSWESHHRYGQQFKIESYTTLLPADIDGIEKYLQSGFIKGVGPSTAKQMVARFGIETFDVIENAPQRLTEIEGIGSKKAELIRRHWKQHHVVRGLLQFLRSVGVKPSFCAKIIGEYGLEAEEVIRRDPYRLSTDIPGIGFYVADSVARHLGLSKSEPERARAAILHFIQRAVREGHMFVFRDLMIQQCETLFEISASRLEAGIERLAADCDLVIETVPGDTREAVYLTALHQAESGLANRFKALLSVPVASSGVGMDDILQAVLQKLALKLSDDQLCALEATLSHRVVIITGGPGTGKTTLIRSLVRSIHDIFGTRGKRILLAAPTGRAAKRLSEVTGRDAKTIHRLLGYNLQEGWFEKNPDNPLETDMVIVDEASMVDTPLMHHLLRAVPMTAGLVLVGDVFQLPPVGPGNVLAEMIASGQIPVFYLNEIFRQSKESPIILNAHKIRQGKAPELGPPEDPDTLSEFYFIEQADPDRAAATIVDICRYHIPRNFHLDPLDDIQVITPMHKGIVGTINLNQLLQKALNQNPETIESMGMLYKTGDKVMHLKNNYQKDVFNGDIGRISAVDKKNSRIEVEYDGRRVDYEALEMNELSLAYAISVHKSQGSEYPAVIVPIMTQHYAMLQRNLLYTAITRGGQLLVLIGTKKALHIALNNDRPRQRNSHLANRLRQI